MKKIKAFWQRNRLVFVSVVFFSLTYVIIGYLWFLLPQEKYYRGGAGTIVEMVVPLLGWAIPFLNQPPYIFIPALSIAGGLAGWITWRLLSLMWPDNVWGISLWILLVLIDYYIGAFLYSFVIMRWLD